MDDAQKLYEKILEVANLFLINAQRFEIRVLRDHNPTYEELAKIMHQLTLVIYDLADDIDPMLAQKANDYVYIMRNMSIAIKEENKVLLGELTEELDQKPFL